MTKNLRQKDQIFKTLNLSFRRDCFEGLSRIDPVSYILMSALHSDGKCKYSSLEGGGSLSRFFFGRGCDQTIITNS